MTMEPSPLEKATCSKRSTSDESYRIIGDSPLELHREADAVYREIVCNTIVEYAAMHVQTGYTTPSLNTFVTLEINYIEQLTINGDGPG